MGTTADRRWDRIAWSAVAAGAAIRLVWVLVLHDPADYVFSDMQGYVARATKLAAGGDLVRFDAFYPRGPTCFSRRRSTSSEPAGVGSRRRPSSGGPYRPSPPSRPGGWPGTSCPVQRPR
jgi:hypothetical protein